MPYTRRQLAAKATLTDFDFLEVERCRGEHNRLGFAYQLGFVRLTGRLPAQEALERNEPLLDFVAAQLGSSCALLVQYEQHVATIQRHQARIRRYLGVRRLEGSDHEGLALFIFEQAQHLEHAEGLLARTKEHLRGSGILLPANSTMHRLIGEHRERARKLIFDRIIAGLPQGTRVKLDELIEVGDSPVSLLQRLKETPGRPSIGALLEMIGRLEKLRELGLFEVDLSWLSRRYQRSLFHQTRLLTADRIRALSSSKRYATMVCFLWQIYADTVDQSVDMFDKLLARTASQAQGEFEARIVKKQRLMGRALHAMHAISHVMVDKGLGDLQLRSALLEKVPREDFVDFVEDLKEWTTGKSRDPFLGITRRYASLRKFSPAYLKVIRFCPASEPPVPSLDALSVLMRLNSEGKRKLPDGTPTDFVQAKLRPFLAPSGSIERRPWECALLLRLREDVRAGNITIEGSKRFAPLDDFFMPQEQWKAYRGRFYDRAGMPSDPAQVRGYLEQRVGTAFDRFMGGAKSNEYAKVDDQGWHVSVDPSQRPDAAQLDRLKGWLRSRVRRIKLPDLLIEVDNEIGFTQHLCASSRRPASPDEVRVVLATIMALGCNIGLQTMGELTSGVSYKRLKRVSDWLLTEETQRAALAVVANAISSLDTSSYWGDGRTSASDGQRFALPHQVLQQTYSHKFGDFSLEHYSFVADNYAPFFSMPIECSDRDAAFTLDGILYNESELELEEHYVDTHGYTEINFGAFALLGRRLCPRIKGVQKQRIYKVDPARDYGPLTSLVGPRNRTLDVRCIAEQWDRLGHLYASFETGHSTASVALRRLAGFSAKNRLYRAAREFGRAFKTEFVLQYMSEPELRTRIRRGLLKVEQLHALARDVFYGRRGKIKPREIWGQMNSCSSLTLIISCIIYWQAREISRAIRRGDPEADGIDLSMLQHISPIEWNNVVLYGQYVISRGRIRVRQPAKA